MPTITAGAAQADITPPVGVDLCGYGARPGPSTGVHDDLTATALAISDGDVRIIVISCDLVGLHHEDVAAVRQDVEVRTGVPAACVMVCCTHTHAGPAMRCIRFLGDPEPEYTAALLDTLAGTAAAACAGSRQARLGRARVPLDVGINRRQLRSGVIAPGTHARGVVDSNVDVVVVDGLDGKPIARLFLHAAHAVALGGDNTLISADWPGVARRTVQEKSPGALGIFLQGCCGDINCREHGWEGVESQGRRSGDAVTAAAAAARWMNAPRLAAASIPLVLPLSPAPALSIAEAVLADNRRRLADLPDTANRGVRWMAEGAVLWSEEMVAHARSGASPGTVPFEVQALRFGDVVLVGLPGEVFVEYAFNIAAASPFAQTMVAAYSNGNVGYIPTAAAYAEGGYEVCEAIRYYGLTMPTAASERLIVDAAQAALAAVS